MDDVKDVYSCDPRGFADVVADAGGITAYSQRTGFGVTAVKKYEFVSSELQRYGVKTDVGESLVKSNKQLQKALAGMRNKWAHLSAALDTYQSVREYVKPSYKEYKAPGDPEILIATIGDTQIGQCVTREETGGLGEYSWDIFKEMVETYKERFSIILDALRKSRPIDTVYLVLGGDMVDGEGIYALQHAHLDMLGWSQVMEGAALIGDIITHISRLAKRVVVNCISGNHGRQQNSTVNLDTFFYAFLKKDLAPLKNVSFNISASHFLLFYIGPELGILDYETKGGRDWIYCALHGNNVKSWNGVPAYGLNRAAWRYTDATDTHIYKMLAFHYHEEAMGKKWIINPSWVPCTDYSLSVMQGASQPMQYLHTHHAREGITGTYPLYLGPKPSLRDAKMNSDGVLTPILEV